jgi:hypothetical protein
MISQACPACKQIATPPPASWPDGPLPTCGARVDVRALCDSPSRRGDAALFVA